MKDLLLVFIGGGLGSLSRFFVSRLFNPLHAWFPVSTLLANVCSCLILGVFIGLTAEKNFYSHPLKLFIFTGFCGGFSTYSAFAFETLGLVETGQLLPAFLNIIMNLLVCIAAIVIGIYIVKNLIPD